ncbi:MAG: PP2C family protein-serine/threonine phosphatase [Acidimicrobiia bacterium]
MVSTDGRHVRDEVMPIEAVVRRIMDVAHSMEPDQVPHMVADVARAAGMREIEVLLVDHRQEHLTSITTSEQHKVEGSLAGDTYRRKREHVTDEGGGSQRVYAPLVDGEDRLGAMTVVVDDATDVVVADVQLLASITAGLIVSKQYYTDSYEFVRRLAPMDLAAEFRWALLPPLTLWTPRIRIAGMLEPAYEIAGDAYDYAVNGNVAHFAMFDAVGHGMRACRIANLAIATYRNCRRGRCDLTDIAKAIDDILIDQFGESWYVTAFLGELDIERGHLRFMSAGHPLPIVLRNGKVVATLETRPGVPLGLGGEPPVVSDAQLEPDDTVFVYSDGVTEARGAGGDFFGEARLVDYLERAASDELSPAETVRRLVGRLYEHAPAPLRDDATMLFVNWRKSDDATDDGPG